MSLEDAEKNRAEMRVLMAKSILVNRTAMVAADDDKCRELAGYINCKVPVVTSTLRGVCLARTSMMFLHPMADLIRDVRRDGPGYGKRDDYFKPEEKKCLEALYELV